jgi:Tol biopolymer transport system component
VWSKDGKRLHYVDGGQKLIAADIRTEKDSVQVSARRTTRQLAWACSSDRWWAWTGKRPTGANANGEPDSLREPYH